MVEKITALLLCLATVSLSLPAQETVESLLGKVDSLAAAGNYLQAELHLQQAREKQPDEAMRERVFGFYLDIGEFEKAYTLSRPPVEEERGEDLTEYFVEEVRWEDEEPEPQELPKEDWAWLEANLDLNPGDHLARYRLSRWYARQENSAKQEFYLRECLRIRADYRPALDDLFTLLRAQDRYPAAELLLHRLIKRYSAEIPLRLSLARLYQDWGKPTHAQEVWEQVLQQTEDTEYRRIALQALVTQHQGQNQFDREERSLQQGVQEGLFPATHLREFYQRMAFTAPDSFRYHLMLALHLEEEENWVAAFSALKTALALTQPPRRHKDTEIWAGHLALKAGRAAERSGRHREAAMAYGVAGSWLKEKDRGAMLLFCDQLIKVNQREKAYSTLEKYHQQGRLDFHRLQNLAEMHLLSGHFAKADSLLTTLAGFPTTDLARVYHLQGRSAWMQAKAQEAIAKFEKAIEADYRKHEAYFLLALNHLQLDQPERALDWLKALAQKLQLVYGSDAFEAWQHIFRKDERLAPLRPRLKEHEIFKAFR